MKGTAAGLGMVALLALCVATPVDAQELERGTWTGMMTLPGGSGVPVTFEVGEADGALSIVMSNPQLGDVALGDPRLDGGELTFWWEPGIRVDCSLLLKEDRSFQGICTDGRGAGGEGTLTMMPPGR